MNDLVLREKAARLLLTDILLDCFPLNLTDKIYLQQCRKLPELTVSQLIAIETLTRFYFINYPEFKNLI